MSPIHGSCHCRNLTYTVLWPEDDPAIAIRECGCSFCTKHGGAWTSNPKAELTVRIADDEHVSRYRFGTATANFYICRQCGGAPFVISEIDGEDYAVINTNCFDDIDTASYNRSPSNFGGEGTEDRLSRRKKNWIKQVRFSAAETG